MVKIYFDKNLNGNIIKYTFQEIFRYIDIKYSFTNLIEEANIIYSDIDYELDKIIITPNKLFWKNIYDISSLPKSPLIKKNNMIYIYENDIISSSFFLLSGYEEYLNLQRDKFNRFLYKYSFYKDDGIYTIPLIEEYRELLIDKLNSYGIKCKRKNIWEQKEFGLFLTHDVDGVYKYRSIFKSLAKILLKPSKFNLRELINSKKNIKNDPYFKGFYYLMEQSKKYNFKSTFFFITKNRYKLDNFYDLNDKYIQIVIQDILSNNFEIGLHGSFESYNNLKYLEEEYKRLKNIYGVRQHYLRYDINKTSFIQNKIFKYDSTLGFPDMIGFRRGTCLPFQVFDIKSNTILNLIEYPLNVMDVTLKGYMKLSTQQALKETLNLIQKIKLYNGLFTLLWHPGNCSDEWNIWLKEFYENILAECNFNDINSLNGYEIYYKIVKDNI